MSSVVLTWTSFKSPNGFESGLGLNSVNGEIADVRRDGIVLETQNERQFQTKHLKMMVCASARGERKPKIILRQSI